MITGGSGGIGTAVLESIRSEYEYAINFDIAAKQDDSFCKFIPCDLSSAADVEKAIKSIDLENITAFIHCAGYGGPFYSIDKIGEETWDRIFTINIKSAFLILKHLLPEFKNKNYGRAVFIASSQSVIGAKYSVAYSSSKHALIGMTKSLAEEWGEFGITINSVSPGYVDTSMGVQEDKVSDHLKKVIAMTPSKRIAKPQEIARVVKFLLSEESGYINGANWLIDGGITAV